MNNVWCVLKQLPIAIQSRLALAWKVSWFICESSRRWWSSTVAQWVRDPLFFLVAATLRSSSSS